MKKPLIILEICFVCFIGVLIIYFLKLHSQGPNSNQQGSNGSTSPLTHTINFSSELSNYNATLSDKTFLRDQLEALNFWGFNAVYTYRQPLQVTVSSVTIHLTDKALSDDRKIFSTQGVVDNAPVETNALGEFYDTASQHLDVYIYIDPNILKNMNQEAMSQLLSEYTLQSLFDITNPPSTSEVQNKAVQDNKIQFLQSLKNIKDQSFINFSTQ